MNTNKIQHEWSLSSEELETMYSDYLAEQRARDEKYGKYRNRYELELQSLRERYQIALEHEELKLSEFWARKWKVMKGYPSFWNEKEAA